MMVPAQAHVAKTLGEQGVSTKAETWKLLDRSGDGSMQAAAKGGAN